MGTWATIEEQSFSVRGVVESQVGWTTFWSGTWWWFFVSGESAEARFGEKLVGGMKMEVEREMETQR